MHSWWTIVHGVTKSQTTEHACALEMTLNQNQKRSTNHSHSAKVKKEGRVWLGGLGILQLPVLGVPAELEDDLTYELDRSM